MAGRESPLDGRVAIITGASSGIGAATARAFAAAGASVVLVARRAEELRRLAAELPGQPLAVAVDVADAEAVRELVRQVVERYQRVDILVNNAGVGLAAPVADLDPADLERSLAVNLFGPLHLIQAALPYMHYQPGQTRPQIIQVSSVVALRSLPYQSGYSGAKAALERMSEALRVELRDRNIVVTVVRPGTTDTPFREQRLGGGADRRRFVPRGVPPERVAAAILRAAVRQPRVAYVRLSDRIVVWTSLLAPGLADRVLGRIISWRG